MQSHFTELSLRNWTLAVQNKTRISPNNEKNTIEGVSLQKCLCKMCAKLLLKRSYLIYMQFMSVQLLLSRKACLYSSGRGWKSIQATWRDNIHVPTLRRVRMQNDLNGRIFSYTRWLLSLPFRPENTNAIDLIPYHHTTICEMFKYFCKNPVFQPEND